MFNLFFPLANLHLEFAVVGCVTLIFLVLFVVAGVRQIRQRHDDR